MTLGVALDDTNLQSAALDGLGGNAQQRGDYAVMAAPPGDGWTLGRAARPERADRRRVHGRLGGATRRRPRRGRDHLPGDLPARSSPDRRRTGRSTCRPGGRLTAELQGNWDEVERIASRAHALWQQLDRVAAGYATRGFLAAFEVARARRDECRHDPLARDPDRDRRSLPRLDPGRHGAAVMNGDAGRRRRAARLDRHQRCRLRHGRARPLVRL